MIINRIWAMPSKWTFEIKPIKELLKNYVSKEKIWVDPFAGKYSPATITNDLNKKMDTNFHMDALDFLKTIEKESVDGAFFDPPYSVTQLKRVYDDIGLSLTGRETKCSYWSDIRDEYNRIVKKGGIVISCGWSSNGVGKLRGFDILEILMVPHGGSHNDTIVTVEKKIFNEIQVGLDKQRRLLRKKENGNSFDLFET